VKKLNHIIESQQFDKELLEYIFSLADSMKSDHSQHQIKGKILATLFYEPSTRTRLSFESAMLQLGGNVLSTESAKEFSSFSKGESLEDTIKVTSGYADIIALRHFDIGAAKRAALVSDKPIINAGDGAGQHPTQALLDLYTIQNHFKSINDMTICLVGDLRYGRTVRSLCYLLGRFYKPRILFVAPKICEMAEDIRQFLTKNGVHWEKMDFETAIEEADCIYMTRIQKERFLDMGRYSQAINKFKIDNSILPTIKPGAIVLHPLPRESEIHPEVDDDPRMIYFEQAQNGVWIRMAIIHLLLSSSN
jgi:aspartate carbamoyltransferase catalytic subunit